MYTTSRRIHLQTRKNVGLVQYRGRVVLPEMNFLQGLKRTTIGWQQDEYKLQNGQIDSCSLFRPYGWWRGLACYTLRVNQGELSQCGYSMMTAP